MNQKQMDALKVGQRVTVVKRLPSMGGFSYDENDCCITPSMEKMAGKSYVISSINYTGVAFSDSPVPACRFTPSMIRYTRKTDNIHSN